MPVATPWMQAILLYPLTSSLPDTLSPTVLISWIIRLKISLISQPSRHHPPNPNQLGNREYRKQEIRERFFYFSFLLFRATPAAHGRLPARGQIRAAAAGLYHSHGNAKSERYLQPILQRWILNPLSEARD